MTPRMVARLAGWSAILAVLLFVVGIITEQALIIGVSSALGAPFFYGMFFAHKGGKESFARIAMAAGMLGSLAGLLAPTPLYDSLFMVSAVVLGLGILFFAYLGLSTEAVPKVLAMLGLLTGGLQVLFGFVPDLGGDTLGMVLILTSLIWQVWFATLFLRSRLLA